MIRKLVLGFSSIISCLVFSNDSFSQCGTESVAITQYCPDQYAEFDINNTDPKVKYHWTNTASSSDYGFTNHFISPSTFPAGSGSVSYKYVKEITDTTGPRTKTTNLNGIAGNSNAAVGAATPSNSYGAIFDAQATIVINSIVVPVGTNYAPPGSSYAVQVKITGSGGAVQNSAITSFSYSSLKPVSGTNNFYLLPVPVNLTVAAGTGYTLELTMTTSDGNSLFYWFNPGTLGYPYTLNSAPSLITVKEKSYSLYSSNRIAAIMDWSITTLCPTKTVASNEQTNTTLCCTPVASAATITTSTGTNVVVSPFSMTLTANGLPSTYYYEWFKNGVLVSGSAGVGKTTLNINSLGNYTVRAVINQSDVTKYSCYKETAISIQERVLYAQASKVNACIGENITLTAKGATANVTWSPATNLNVTNTAKVIATPMAVGSLTYNVTAEVPLGNSVINGDFENGNTGFSSSLTYVAPTINLNQNQYSVRKSVNPQGGLWKECPDHTTGSGNLFYTDGPTTIGASVWKQTISVQPNTNYTFSAWVTNTYASSDPSDPGYTVNATNARFQLQANGQALLATPFVISGKTCKWENVKSVWNSGNNTSITIGVLDMNSDGYGNDFALDDITFGAPGTQTDKVTLNVTDCFFVNATALTTCKGDSVQIEAETNGLFAGWQLQGGGTTGIKTPNNPITWVKPGATNQTYVASATFQLGNLLTNGDFEEGDKVGFTSDYKCCLGSGISHYSIDTDPRIAAVGASWAVSKKDHTSGEGLMFMSDGGKDPTEAVYTTTVEVVTGKQYAFSAWLANIHNEFLKPIPDTNNNAKTTNLGFVVNGQNLGNIKLPLDTAWHQFYSTWTSNFTGTITISIQDKETSSFGNDFVLDDIVFAPLYPTTKTTTINAGPCTICNLPSSVNILNTKTSQCEGNGLTLTGTFNNGGKIISNGGMYYAWYKQGASLISDSYSLISPNPTGTGSVNVPNKSFASLLKSSDEGKWVLRVQDGNNPSNTGCYKEDTVTISVKSLPTVTAPTSGKVCSGSLFTGAASYTTSPASGVTVSWDRTLPSGITGTATGLPKTGQVSETLTSTNATSTNVVYKLTPSYSTAPACPGTVVDYTVAVNPLPAAPTTATNPVAYCQNATAVALVATAVGTNTLKWYGTDATGGTASTTAPTPVTTATGTTSYYVSQATAGTPSCESTRLKIDVTVSAAPAKPTVRANAICKDAAFGGFLGTATPGNTLKWYGTDSTAASTATPVPNISNAVVTTYYVAQTNNTTLCQSKMDSVVVRVNALPVVGAIGTVADMCEATKRTFTLAGSNATSTYTWTVSGGATPTSGTGQTLEITSGTADFTISVSEKNANGCTSASPATQIIKVDRTPPTAQVSTNTFAVCALDAVKTLNATAVALPSKGVWSKEAGSSAAASIADLNNPSSAITIAGGETLIAKWKVSSALGVCTGSEEIVTVTATSAVVATVTLSADTTALCLGGSILLKANPTNGGTTPSYKLMPGNVTNTTGVFKVSPTSNQSYTVEMTSASNCVASKIVNSAPLAIKVVTPPVANITSPPNTFANPYNINVNASATTNLVANPAGTGYTGTWTKVGQGTINSNTGALTGLAIKEPNPSDGTGTTKVVWTIKDNDGACKASADSVRIVNVDKTIPNAGPDKTVCSINLPLVINGLPTTLIPTIETSSWVSVNPIATANNSQLTINAGAAAGKYSFYFQINNTVTGLTTDTVVVTIIAPTTADITNPGTAFNVAYNVNKIAADLVPLAAGIPAAGYSGKWSIISGQGSISPSNNSSANLTGLAIKEPTVSNGTGTTKVRWVVRDDSSACPSVGDSVTIVNVDKTIPNAGPDKTVCSINLPLVINGLPTTLIPTIETSSWVSVNPIATANNSQLTINAGAAAGKYSFYFQINNTVTGLTTDTVVVTIIAPTTADITNPGTAFNVAYNVNKIAADLVPLAAGMPAAGYSGKWSIISGQGSISPSNNSSANLTGLAIKEPTVSDGSGTTKVRWVVRDDSSACPSVGDSVTIVNVDKNIPNAGPDKFICSATDLPLVIDGLPSSLIPGIETASWILTPVGTSVDAKLTIPSGTLPGTYTFRFEINNTVTGKTTDDVVVRIDEETTQPTFSSIGAGPYTTASPYVICTDALVLAGDKNNQTLGKNWWTKTIGTGTLPVADSTHNPNLSAISGKVELTFNYRNGVCPTKTTGFVLEKLGDLTKAVVKLNGGKSDLSTKQYSAFDLSVQPGKLADTLCLGGTYTLNADQIKATETGVWSRESGTSVVPTPVDAITRSLNAATVGTTVLKWKVSSNLIATCKPDSIMFTLVVRDVPTGIISGPSPVCEGAEGTYSVAVTSSLTNFKTSWIDTTALTGKAVYNKATNKYTFTSTATTGSVDVNGIVKVKVTNRCGSTFAPLKQVDIALKPRTVADTIGNGGVTICSTNSGITFGLKNQGAGITTAWTFNGAAIPTNVFPLADSATAFSALWSSVAYINGLAKIDVVVTLSNACGAGASKDTSISIQEAVPLIATLKSFTTKEGNDAIGNQRICLPNQKTKFMATNGNSIALADATYQFYRGTVPIGTSVADSLVYQGGQLADKEEFTVTVSSTKGCFTGGGTSIASNKIIIDGYSIDTTMTVTGSVDLDGTTYIVCAGDVLNLNVLNNSKGNNYYKWYKLPTIGTASVDSSTTRRTTSISNPDQTGQYFVKISNDVCDDEVGRTVDVKVYEKPAFEFLVDPLVIVYQQGIKVPMPVILTSPTLDSITKTTWSNVTWLTYPIDTVNAVIVPERVQTELDYTLTVKTGPANLSCQTERSIRVINALPLVIPNAFSPNGDGVNDTWVITGLIKYTSITISVFNRWGNKVFYSTGAYTPWDGTVNGLPVSSGTYYAIIELKGSPDSTDDNVTKALTIVR